MAIEDDTTTTEGMTVEQFIAARHKLGMTQEGLATLLGMSTRALQDIENGRAKLRLVHVLATEMILVTTCAMRNDHTLLHERIKELVLRAALSMRNLKPEEMN